VPGEAACRGTRKQAGPVSRGRGVPAQTARCFVASQLVSVFMPVRRTAKVRFCAMACR
jgi:hypothetical protein